MSRALIVASHLVIAQGALPSKYYASYVKGKFKRYFNENSYGCPVGWYTDNGKWGYPYCPGDTIEVHSDFVKLNANSRDNSGSTNHVSCMTCTDFGSSSEYFLGQAFEMVCNGDGVVATMKELFSDALYGDNTFAFEPDGTFSFPNGASNSGLYQRWTAGTDGKMVWTTHHNSVCGGICDLRYTLVEPAAGFGNAEADASWFTIVNYYEVGQATCDIVFVEPKSWSRRLSQIPSAPLQVYSSVVRV